MKRALFLLAIPVIGTLSFILTSNGGGEHDYPSGAPSGYTGSPGDGKTCTQCHGGTAAPVSGWITSDIPAAGYTPGNTYNITVTVSGSGHKGFEVSPQNVAGAQLGTLIAGSTSHLTGGTKYVTHNSDPTSNPATWIFQWTAPAAGTGEVTFYGAFAVSKNTTKTSTLVVGENAAVPLTVVATATPMTILIGDSSQLDATPAGGTGTYTYSWTSVPAGFTSTLKNPWVKPLEPTQYIVVVSDGSSTASDNVTVDVSNVGIADRKGTIEASVYPNPTAGMLNVYMSASSGVARCSILSLDGRIIMEKPLQTSANGMTAGMDLAGIPDGIYLARITNGEGEKTLKLIKSTK